MRVAGELIALGEGVVVIAREIEPRFRVQLEAEGVRVCEGDARDVADLKDAGLDSARAIAIVEENDVGNLHAALAARSARDDIGLVVRIFNPAGRGIRSARRHPDTVPLGGARRARARARR